MLLLASTPLWESDHLQTIAAVSYEPIWVFYRGKATIGPVGTIKRQADLDRRTRQRPA